MDLEQKAIERIRLASDLSLKHYGKPLVCTYSGGKDSDVMLELFRRGAYHLRYTIVTPRKMHRKLYGTYERYLKVWKKKELNAK
jgi:3'-phosphoadenosine 5'-phosphosulfate sulfotransferase (PAPS reductase)/FAD synthetase